MSYKPWSTPVDEELWAKVRHMPSDQIARVFDRYFFHILHPIALYTDVVYEALAEGLVILLTNKRRKMTRLDRDEVAAQVFHAMHADRATLAQTVIATRIERSFIVDIADAVLTGDVKVNPAVSLDALRRHVSVLVEDVLLFRSLIYRRYASLVHKHGSSFAWGQRRKGLMVEPEDASQNYAMAALRAIDRFDMNEGTITGYLTRSLRSGQHSHFNLGIGEAYSVTRSVRTKMQQGTSDLNNHSVNIDAPSVSDKVVEIPEEHDHTQEYTSLLADTVALLRATGRVHRFKLGLIAVHAEAVLTPEEIEAQRTMIVEDNS